MRVSIGFVVVLLLAACSSAAVQTSREYGVSYPESNGFGDKIDSDIKREMVRNVQPGKSPLSRSGWSILNRDKLGRIQIHIYVNNINAANRSALEAAGAKIQFESDLLGAYQAWVSPEDIGEVASHDFVIRVAAPKRAFTK